MTSEHTVIIAEAGVNHNGDLNLARELVQAAAEAGADVVKFQTFKAKNLVTKGAEKAKYQIENTGTNESQYEMLKRLELSYDAHHELLTLCKQKNIEFLSTAFDLESLEFLVGELGLKTLKIPSGEITNALLILAHAQSGCDLIVSTGMSTLGEIETALGVIAFGLISDVHEEPAIAKFRSAYFQDKGQELLRQKLTLLHCTSNYPTPPEEVNLNAMITMEEAFSLKVGYSDHTLGVTMPAVAVAMGAKIIEKHFTLDRNLEGPDHRASLEPEELKKMVEAIRAVEKAKGTGLKGPQSSELATAAIARKSLIAALPIRKGEVFTKENLIVKRPGTGIEPIHYWDYLGKVATRDYSEDEVI